MTQNSRDHLHSKLALEIKAAKRTMFKRHREGMDLREAADKFAFDVAGRFENVLSSGQSTTIETGRDDETQDRGLYSQPGAIERITEVIAAGDDGEHDDGTIKAFSAVLSEFERLAERNDVIGIQDLAASLMISVYQESRICERAAFAFAKTALREVSHA